jgi:hypothetical protein
MSNQQSADIRHTFDLNPEDLSRKGREKLRALFIHYYPDADWDYLTIEWPSPILICDVVRMPVQDFPKKPDKKRRWRR